MTMQKDFPVIAYADRKGTVLVIMGRAASGPLAPAALYAIQLV